MREDGRMLVRSGPARPVYAGEDPVWPFEQAEPSSTGGSFRKLGQVLLRRKGLIALAMVVMNLAAIAAMHSVRPRYSAEASVLIGPRQVEVVDLKGVLAGLTGEGSDVIEDQIQVLRSRRIARAVVDKLQLDQAHDLNPSLAAAAEPPGAVSQTLSALGARAVERWHAVLAVLPKWLRTLVVGPPPVTVSATPTAADPLTVEVDNFLKRLTVAPSGRSRVVKVGFQSADPQEAAAAANAVADTYIADQLEEKLDATAHARKWLDERVSELREQVINADKAVEAYRQRAGIAQGRTGTLLSEQLSTLGEQVVQARVDQARAEAKLDALRSGRGADSMAEVASSAALQTLRAQEATARARLADVTRVLGEQNPRALQARAEAEAATASVRAETGRLSGSVRQEADAARARVASLTASLDALRKSVNLDNASEVELRALQHEADADRALYDRLLTRSRETSVEGGLQQPDAQVLSRAEPPTAPSFPNPMLILPLVFIVSCLATGLLVFAVENLDHGFTSLEQIEEILGVGVLGLVPEIKSGFGGRRTPGNYVLDRPQSAYGEAIRSLHTSLMLSDVERPPKVILVASALPGEGKSSTVLSLARLMASCGKRVAVIDCDLRRPDLHRAFGTAETPGLTDCLLGQASVFDVLRLDTQSPAYLVPAGSHVHTSPDLLGSDAMRSLVATLAERFDLVLLDSAPVLAVSDTRNLCRLADKTVFVVRWQSTRRFAAKPALRQVVEAGGDLAGVLLSMVDLNGYARHSVTGFHQRQLSYYFND